MDETAHGKGGSAVNRKISVTLAGASGYTGGELIRLLLLHPNVSEIAALSSTHAGKAVSEVHSDLFWASSLYFSQTEKVESDVLFLCLPHGKAQQWMNSVHIAAHTKIIDLSADFRNGSNGFVYGLPELNRNEIAAADRVANPGCFATAIQLALLPLATANQLRSPIEITAVTGSTGAGQQLAAGVHYTWRSANHSAYKELEHQHEAEIIRSLTKTQPGFDCEIHFIPQRGNFTRGIWAALHTETTLRSTEAEALFRSYYHSHPFTKIITSPADVKMVVNTNYCAIQVCVKNNRVLVTSVIDNLLKGASGQAVQNMNLLFGFPEHCGLQLKPSAY